MTIDVVSVLCGGQGPTQSYVSDGRPLIELHNFCNNQNNGLSPCVCYNRLLYQSASDVIAYIHDDVTIHDPNWLGRVHSLFASNPECVCVGFGGATALGSPDLYKQRYQLSNMARRGYCSNQTDWQTHGSHEKGDKRVAVVDAFFMAVRTNFLRDLGGWPVDHLTHHCLDLWVACEAAHAKKEVWMTGVHCTHHGGGSSTKPAYQQAKWLQGRSLEQDHQRPHRWLYEEYSDVLPIEIKGGADAA